MHIEPYEMFFLHLIYNHRLRELGLILNAIVFDYKNNAHGRHYNALKHTPFTANTLKETFQFCE